MKSCHSLLLVFLLCGFGCIFNLSAQTATKPDLALAPGDVRIDQSDDGGYLLFVRKKPDIQSVILTESTADPARKLDSYTLRSKEANAINGGEKRRLNGKFIESPGMYFLISSTVVADAEFGQAFRIFIPYLVVFGYPTARYGEISMQDGAYFNIRSFALPYADYGGAYRDNPYSLRLIQKANQTGSGGFNKEAVRAFQSLAEAGKGSLSWSKGGSALIADLAAVLASQPAGPVEVAICLDATKSMENEAPYIRKDLFPVLRDFVAGRPGTRVALVQYRDYLEDFLYRIAPFSDSLDPLRAQLLDYVTGEGRDTPEAVLEGVYACLTELDWTTARKVIILVGDAPPHPLARGSVSNDQVTRRLGEIGVTLQAIILPE